MGRAYPLRGFAATEPFEESSCRSREEKPGRSQASCGGDPNDAPLEPGCSVPHRLGGLSAAGSLSQREVDSRNGIQQSGNPRGNSRLKLDSGTLPQANGSESTETSCDATSLVFSLSGRGGIVPRGLSDERNTELSDGRYHSVRACGNRRRRKSDPVRPRSEAEKSLLFWSPDSTRSRCA